MSSVSDILMATEGPGFDSQKRHFALVAQLVEHRSYTNLYANAAIGESRGFDSHKEHLFFSQYLTKQKMLDVTHETLIQTLSL